MRVRMKVDVSGTRNGQPWPRRGQVADVDDAEGAQLCHAGLAEPVAVAEPVETATAPSAEQRAVPAKKAKTARG